tara:strand:- start:41 stop:1030 length:990 start_codon:yes stop_codon:yes gene_type:complete
MPTQKTSGDLISLISSELSDNNAGLISALDVRHNMEDAVLSGPYITAISNTENTYYFRNNVLVSGDSTSIDGGTADKHIITEGGIRFPNVATVAGITNNIQVEPYPGAGNIQHNDLAGLAVGDPHTQYLLETGGTTGGMRGNLRMRQNSADPHWIGPSGLDDQGIQFTYDFTSSTPLVNINARPVYADGSTHQDMNGSGTAKGIAKAWCNFDASGVSHIPVVRSSYNINSVQRISKGVIKITFASGIFADNNYAAVGNSNANAGSGTYDTFDINAIGLMLREGDDANSLRSIHYVIRSDDNDLVDAELNDFVAYGLGPNTIADAPPTVS